MIADMMQGKDTIIDEWNTVKVPPPPELKEVQVDPKVTALLILDIQNQNCNVERRPRCVASVPKIRKLLTESRAKGVSVVYSLTRTASTSDIIKDIAPLEGDSVVQSGPDKFFLTDLEKILMEKNVETVIVVGTAAHGAVLHTATGAALRGLQVIVPVDGMSASEQYPEQYAAWHLANAPASKRQTTLTRIDLIQVSEE
jgi:nicotinamidase-related amidase